MIRDALRRLVPMRHRNRLARARVSLRRPTGKLRRLPDFLVIGAMRAGTSSLYRYLGAHPGVTPALRKEVEYFTRWYDRGAGWYRSHFPLAALAADRACFEATPYYLLHPHAPRRAARLLPEARLVVMLREPVARALSHHRHLVRLGIETLSFEEAVDREPERLAGELDRLEADPGYESRSYHLFSYVERGLYARQLRRWLDSFPAERFLILEHETFFREPEAEFDRLLRFLGLEPWSPPAFRNYSRAARPAGAATGPGPDLPPALRQRLARHFAPHNRELEELLGRRFDWS